MHELTHDDAGYHLRIFLHDPDADRELTREEAGEWIETVRSCGGSVYRQRQAVSHG
jgi:hypothetical protein